MHEDSDSVNDLELNDFINESYHELYDLIVASDEARLFAVNATNPPRIGDYAFQLPYDFYRVVSVHVYRDGHYIPALPADPAQYAELAANRSAEAAPRYFIRWDINTGGRFVYVFPEPATETLAITYFPQPRELSLDSDGLDNPASWLEFVTTSAGIKMLNKIERDATALLFAKRQLEKRIMAAVYASDFNSPRRIRDLSYRSGFGGGRW
jgi:hypothetical protein